MAEIKIQIDSLNDAITKLETLKSTCEDADTSCTATIGGGKTINEIESIAAVYKNLNTSFTDLVSNTISFMKNVRDSYQSNDQKAAQKISGS